MDFFILWQTKENQLENFQVYEVVTVKYLFSY